MLDVDKVKSFADKFWNESAVAKLSEFVSIPSKNQAFDPNWQENGHILKAVNLIADWIKSQNLAGTEIDVVTLPGKTPFLFVEIPASEGVNKTVAFYNHLDKMPESEGWDEGKGPWTPVLECNKLYGRGAADDGSGTFVAMTAVKILEQHGIPHPRYVFLIETSEENGSPDFNEYIELLADRIGNTDLFIFLDDGGLDEKRFWVTNSLRGSVIGALKVETMTKNIHSGAFGGLVASPFRILRQLLSRVEDEKTGELLLPELKKEVPNNWVQAVKDAAKVIGNSIYNSLPLLPGCQPVSKDPEVSLFTNTWSSSLSVIGISGVPELEHAGNVIHASTTLLLNFRIPPHVDVNLFSKSLKATFEASPPYAAKVSFTQTSIVSGWSMMGAKPWLIDAIAGAAKNYFGFDPSYKGEGAAIGVVEMIAKKYPTAQFLITGVINTSSNCHGPNEYIDLPLAKKISCGIAHILAAYMKS